MAVANLERLSYAYPGTATLALRSVSAAVGPGLTLVAGPSGSGKSSLLRVLNGLVPQFHGGRVSGRAEVAGHDALRTPTRELARSVGFVFQDPELSFVYGSVEREVAFAPENLGMPTAEMHRRVDEALERLAIGHLRGRRIATLSGGERQRVALAAALVLRPSILVLDEPTSQLDASGAASIVGACIDLAGRGLSVVVSEHRLDRLLPAADRVVVMDRGTALGPASPGEIAATLPAPPPVVELGLRLGWSPLPLDVDTARLWAPLLCPAQPDAPSAPSLTGEPAWAMAGLSVGHAGDPVVERVDLCGRPGEVVVLVGPNGHGKTTLLRALAGLLPPLAGTIERRPGRVAYLPQSPTALLHRPTLRAEVELTLARAGRREPPGRILDQLGLGAFAERYPRDMSSGERQRGAIAAVLAGSPEIALLDEPTRGMDGPARAAIRRVIGELRAGGGAVVLATHDADLAAAVGDRIVEVADRGVRELGAPDRALAGTSPYATQIGELYPDGPVTVDSVLARR